MEDKERNLMEQQNEPLEQLDKAPNSITWGVVLSFILVYLGLAIGTGVFLIFSLAIVGLTQYADVLLRSHYAILFDALAFFLALLIFKKIRFYLRGSFSFHPMKKVKTYGYLVAAFIFVYLAQTLILDVLEWEEAGSQVDTFGFENIPLNGINIFIIILSFTIVTPILEEILFRGIIYRFLRDKYGSWIGVFVSSLVFGVLHPGHILSATISGVVFVLLYRQSKSLVVPIIFHVVWNMFAIYGLLSLVAQ
ncbi:membrane protease YdiL (CAAX protease family) [Natronobacillus azotifigens]|uniref:Type II CAAX endopeptidase family protein n=1 Tax=Natronobacillus azotifigens TaxID=472978 RepID=A0A9J6RFM1_9BACI|nr:type II CAAX endopeptidase family protein [Natronobacillus azotifigens]MCZ0704359.1 type II CAAX endopeptidase family protein [Natronobacillus azotifigens]